jgi:hypothetical protein
VRPVLAMMARTVPPNSRPTTLDDLLGMRES